MNRWKRSWLMWPIFNRMGDQNKNKDMARREREIARGIEIKRRTKFSWSMENSIMCKFAFKMTCALRMFLPYDLKWSNSNEGVTHRALLTICFRVVLHCTCNSNWMQEDKAKIMQRTHACVLFPQTGISIPKACDDMLWDLIFVSNCALSRWLTINFLIF